jgi:hypothetical protein
MLELIQKQFYTYATETNTQEHIIMAIQRLEKIMPNDPAANGEALGASLLALPACLKANEIMPLLERHGFASIDPQKWYPQQAILAMYRDIEEGRSNVSENLVSIGIKSVETMAFPPEIQAMRDMLNTMASSYSMVHRNMLPGEGTFCKFIDDTHVQTTVNTPYPPDIFYGYYWGLMKKYVPEGMNFRIAEVENTDPEVPGTVYDIRWGKDI